MNIACLISSLRLGGAERQMLALASGLQSAGHKVTLITYHKEIFFEEELRAKNLEMVYVPKKNLLQWCLGCTRVLKQNNCEVLISFCAGTNLKACLLTRFGWKGRLIVSERNCNLHFRLHDRLRFLAYTRADAVVCNSHSQEEFIRRHFPALNDRLCTITNAVDLDYFHPRSSAVRQPARKRAKILVTARFCKRKNAIGLIKAAAILKKRGIPIYVEWYGLQREDEYCKKCRELISKTGLSDDFLILPAAHNVVELYHDADIFCLPSFYEGTPNSLAEALACGLPVVCSDVSDNSLYVSEGENGFTFNPEKPSDIADTLTKILAIPGNELLQFGECSRRIAEEKLSGKPFISSYLGIL